MENYLKMAKLEQRASTWKHTERFLKVRSMPLHPLPFTTITRARYRRRAHSIAARGTRMLSNNVRAKLWALFNWAISKV